MAQLFCFVILSAFALLGLIFFFEVPKWMLAIFAVAFLLVVVTLIGFHGSVSCPKCGKSLTLTKGGMTLPFPENICSSCRNDLTVPVERK